MTCCCENACAADAHQANRLGYLLHYDLWKGALMNCHVVVRLQSPVRGGLLDGWLFADTVCGPCIAHVRRPCVLAMHCRSALQPNLHTASCQQVRSVAAKCWLQACYATLSEDALCKSKHANHAVHRSSAAPLTRCFLSAGAVNGRHVVACCSAPEQKATAAERGASSGVQATFPGKRAAVMLAWTPPMLKPHMPAREHGEHTLTLESY